MLRLVLAAWLLICLRVPAAERIFDFGAVEPDALPAGFTNLLVGTGRPGNWKIVFDEVPSAFQALTPNAAQVSKRAVLGQVSRELTDEHFPILAYAGEEYGDFVLTTRIKLVAGDMEQMAGVVFRLRDEANFYYLRLSALGNTFKFFKVVNGVRSAGLGPETPIAAGVWHDLRVEGKGNQIRCLLNGKELIPTLTDTSFVKGRIGFITKSDSVAYFADTRIQFTPLETLAAAVVRETLEKYPRIVDLRIYANKEPAGLQVVAGKNRGDLAIVGTKVEADVIGRGKIYVGKNKKEKTVIVTLPLHDRNGHRSAAVRFELETFAGQTEQNAIARALPMVREMERRTMTERSLIE